MKQLDNKNILYFITSGGEDKKNIEQYVKDNDLENQVIFFGFVENHLIPHFYNASDLVSLISKNEYGKGEGVPLGIIEASSCEVPILAGDEDGSYEALSDKYPNGFRVNPRNIDEIAAKIQYYIDNPIIKKEHGLNGRKFVIEEFEYRKFRDEQAKIIESI
jgi:glycosyltransferase involved in cell wall biosynthesis